MVMDMSERMDNQSYDGTLWIVNKPMLADSDKRNDVNGRKVLIEKGEIIEFRFHSEMHFRTMDNKFYFVSEEVWIEHCLEIAKIIDIVRWNNKATTEETWRLGLFTWCKNGEEIYKKVKEEIKTE